MSFIYNGPLSMEGVFAFFNYNGGERIDASEAGAAKNNLLFKNFVVEPNMDLATFEAKNRDTYKIYEKINTRAYAEQNKNSEFAAKAKEAKETLKALEEQELEELEEIEKEFEEEKERLEIELERKRNKPTRDEAMAELDRIISILDKKTLTKEQLQLIYNRIMELNNILNQSPINMSEYMYNF